MVIIFSENSDLSTCNVIDWLIKFNVPYFRVNVEDIVKIECINIGEKNEVILNINSIVVEFSKITAYWYRRGGLTIYAPDLQDAPFYNSTFHSHFHFEKSIVESFIFKILSENDGIGNFETRSVNKLIVLQEAMKCGLKIPDSKISNSDNVVIKAKFENEIITKALNEAIQLKNDMVGYAMNYTAGIIDDYIHIDNYRFPFLIQKKINKIFEIRSFYLRGKFFSMAIFSQENTQTQNDFRNYDLVNPVRNVPFQLPLEVENKLEKLMQILKLDTGSIDLAFTRDNEYIFFEVNPVGQYGMVSGPCNYNLDKAIAEELLKIYNTNS